MGLAMIAGSGRTGPNGNHPLILGEAYGKAGIEGEVAGFTLSADTESYRDWQDDASLQEPDAVPDEESVIQHTNNAESWADHEDRTTEGRYEDAQDWADSFVFYEEAI